MPGLIGLRDENTNNSESLKAQLNNNWAGTWRRQDVRWRYVAAIMDKSGFGVTYPHYTHLTVTCFVAIAQHNTFLLYSSPANANYKHQEVLSTNQRIRVKLFFSSRKSLPRRWHHLFAGVPTQPPLMIDGELWKLLSEICRRATSDETFMSIHLSAQLLDQCNDDFARKQTRRKLLPRFLPPARNCQPLLTHQVSTLVANYNICQSVSHGCTLIFFWMLSMISYRPQMHFYCLNIYV